MRPAARRLRDLGLLAGALVLLAGMPARAQTPPPTRDDIILQLSRFEAPADIDVAASVGLG